MAERFLNEAGTRRLATRLQQYISTNTQVATSVTSTGTLPPTSQAVYNHVAAAIAGKITAQIVSSLPSTGQANIIYLLEPSTGARHRIFMWVAGDWADLGPLDVDLDGVWRNTNLTAMTSAQIDAILDDVLS